MSKTVLVAESNAYLLEILTEFLSTCGFFVAAATSAKAELPALTAEHKPDLLIFDYGLSEDGMAGLSELNTLKAHHPQMKILVLGFQDAAEEIVKAVQKNGCDGFWNKFESQVGLLQALKLMLA